MAWSSASQLEGLWVPGPHLEEVGSQPAEEKAVVREVGDEP